MARGNNGNALQHVVELACAQFLLRGGSGIRLLSTHCMAPSEALEDSGRADFETGQGTKVLANLLRLAKEILANPQLEAPALSRAFAELGCCANDYPNTARLVGWAAKDLAKPFEARVIEKDDRTFEALSEAWGSDRRFHLVHGSWRRVRDGQDEAGHADPIRRLEPPGDPAWPWLWSMDPYTFVGHRVNPGGHITDSDIQSLRPKLSQAFSSTGQGVFALFCYSMPEETERAFRASVHGLAESIRQQRQEIALRLLGIEKSRGAVHLAALISNSAGALDWAQAELRSVAGAQFRG